MTEQNTRSELASEQLREQDFEESLDIAVVGLAGRFPGAPDIDSYWSLLLAGHCAATRFTEEEQVAFGVSDLMRRDPQFVPVGYPLLDAEAFDAEFFGISPREAELMDPQHRVLLECAVAALERAGLDPDRYRGAIGVYAGAGYNTYLLDRVSQVALREGEGSGKETVLGNRSDFLASRISYRLGLRGPSINVQSACSTSLVAVAEACQALLAYQCDTALAGGVAVDLSRRGGYLYRPEGLFSPDGLCRSLDSRAEGTVPGEGAGLVVLKRLADAIADRDRIHAVIKGSAVNNDGAARPGFTAPSAAGQAACIAAALDAAAVDPASVSYIEVHGSATALGDPVELSALKSAYAGAPEGGIALGAVKSNIGHLDAASGIAGLIKAVLAVENGRIPASLHITEPNPRLGLKGSPFRLADRLTDWPEQDWPRRAGVSSFGLGGTNAHLILEQAPDLPPEPPDELGDQLLVLSAKTPEALDQATDRLYKRLQDSPGLPLARVATTLQHGRRQLPHRRALLARSTVDALSVLADPDGGRLLTGEVHAGTVGPRPVAFMFSGFGNQYPGMAAELYEEQPVFRAGVDRCAELLLPLLGQDIRTHAFTHVEAPSVDPADGLRRLLLQPTRSEHPLSQPELGYPTLFALEYALVDQWAAWGVRPTAMIGHSLGEYVAACVAGVFSLPDALRLVVERARLIERQGEGAMAAVHLGEREVARYLGPDVCLAAVNAPRTSVLSGSVEALREVLAVLNADGVAARMLDTRQAFHSPMMDPIVEPYAEVLAGIELRAPRLPFVSNVSGTWITEQEAVDPRYWARHLRAMVRFADGAATLWAIPDVALLEVGPGQSLAGSAIQHPAAAESVDRLAVSSLPGAMEQREDRTAMLGAAARLWLGGVPAPFPAPSGHRREPLPEYPFERRPYLLDRDESSSAGERSTTSRVSLEPERWLHTPSWRRLPRRKSENEAGKRWLVFLDPDDTSPENPGPALVAQLRGAGAEVRTVRPGPEWHCDGHDQVIDPDDPSHYRLVAEDLRASGGIPERMVHCWTSGTQLVPRNEALPDDLADLSTDELSSAAVERTALERGFFSVVRWAQAVEPELMTDRLRWDLLATRALDVLDEDRLCPGRAALRGLVPVLRQEYPGLACGLLDPGLEAEPEQVLAELLTDRQELLLALRGRYRWAPSWIQEPPAARTDPPVRPGGVHLITGGLGRIGLLAARHLAELAPSRLVLLGRSSGPPPGGPAEQALRELTKLGSEVLVLVGDVADPARMAEVKREVLEHFGPIEGLMHCAGTTGPAAHQSVAELDTEQAERHFAGKVHGPRVLAALLADQPLRYALLCSSVAAQLGGLGFASYAAANAALDARARVLGGVWCAVNWEAWNFPEVSGEDGSALGNAVRDLALRPDEGRQVLDLVLHAEPEPQLLVSTAEFEPRLELWSEPVAASHETRRRHRRPRLRNPYQAPAGPTEQRIAAIWQEVLGIDEVGAHDNFFELGGNSLLGLRVVHRLRGELSFAVPLTTVYEGPTVRSLARVVNGLAGAMEGIR